MQKYACRTLEYTAIWRGDCRLRPPKWLGDVSGQRWPRGLLHAPAALLELQNVAPARLQLERGHVLVASVPIHGPAVPAAGTRDADRHALAGRDGRVQ